MEHIVWDWAPSVSYATALVQCPLEKAWPVMLDYQAWNPDFAQARVKPVRGESGGEGELVLIQHLDAQGAPAVEFYAETVKLVPLRHIVWYVYPKEGAAFCNFVDFHLSEIAAGVRFGIDYYSQSPLCGAALDDQRKALETSLTALVAAFKQYCEGKVSRSHA